MASSAGPMKKVQSKDLKSERLIGKGPSGIVYETTWEGKRYARKDFLRVPSDVFEEEAAALVGLDHPNVVRTYCWTVDAVSCSLVLELMDDDLLNLVQKRKQSQPKAQSPSSQTSHDVFMEDGKNAGVGAASESVAIPPFHVEEALFIILQIAQGMKFLHDKGVVHGDLKPKNILVTPSGRVATASSMAVKVADFGLVKTKMESRSFVSRHASKLEMVRWRAPELLEFQSGLKEDELESSDSDWDSEPCEGKICVVVQKNASTDDMMRADVYNFALTCSQILTGKDPYPNSDGQNDVMSETSQGWRPELPPSTCPAELSGLLKRCWGEKTERPHFQDILSELKNVQASLTRTETLTSLEQVKSHTMQQHTVGNVDKGDGPEITTEEVTAISTRFLPTGDVVEGAEPETASQELSAISAGSLSVGDVDKGDEPETTTPEG